MPRYEPDYESGCKYKEAFPNRRTAQRGAKKKHHVKGGKQKLMAYKCTFCPNWHVGKTMHRSNTELKPYDRKTRRKNNRIVY